ncbi:MAG: rod shape-determining protein MreC [Nitrospinae bacterium RIFCSPLOWO2_02_39_17]|nr:MAG: rod shape-determining protein MreC [Nitrospinae bacterium RIFCSPHIGHO2_12_FULL_39_42]OGW06767.1 MAG: rod shape-determining protein MreC [Nitrospinae bacterium RIFCSPLOWO2_02_39_17]OGW09365.1 MAG: rod shape-determining protein MreC [Nitrospinae bacterium RIFCSPLOWO2_12_39_15]
MLKKDSKNRHGIIAVIILLIISFLLLTINIKSGEAPTFVEPIVNTLISPFQELVSATISGINRILRNYVFLTNIQEENSRLRKDIDSLKFQNNILVERLNKFQRMEKLSDFLNTAIDFNFLPADVVAFDSTGWMKTVTINKGLKDGIRKNMTVVTYNGLVGRVVQTMAGYSKVLLITDPRSSVDAIIQRTRDRGIVIGANHNVLEMKYLSINSDVKEGDVVISSGAGGIFQKGLSIGVISKIHEKNDGLFRRVAIVPSADLLRIEELLVIVSPFEASGTE